MTTTRNTEDMEALVIGSDSWVKMKKIAGHRAQFQILNIITRRRNGVKVVWKIFQVLQIDIKQLNIHRCSDLSDLE